MQPAAAVRRSGNHSQLLTAATAHRDVARTPLGWQVEAAVCGHDQQASGCKCEHHLHCAPCLALAVSECVCVL